MMLTINLTVLNLDFYFRTQSVGPLEQQILSRRVFALEIS